MTLRDNMTKPRTKVFRNSPTANAHTRTRVLRFKKGEEVAEVESVLMYWLEKVLPFDNEQDVFKRDCKITVVVE